MIDERQRLRMRTEVVQAWCEWLSHQSWDVIGAAMEVIADYGTAEDLGPLWERTALIYLPDLHALNEWRDA